MLQDILKGLPEEEGGKGEEEEREKDIGIKNKMAINKNLSIMTFFFIIF